MHLLFSFASRHLCQGRKTSRLCSTGHVGLCSSMLQSLEILSPSSWCAFYLCCWQLSSHLSCECSRRVLDCWFIFLRSHVSCPFHKYQISCLLPCSVPAFRPRVLFALCSYSPVTALAALCSCWGFFWGAAVTRGASCCPRKNCAFVFVFTFFQSFVLFCFPCCLQSCKWAKML